MAECMKLMNDLKQMSAEIPVPLLTHFFTNYDPSESKSLKETIAHFKIRDLEASDYRSAYHQFADWLYGWNVTDASEFVDIRDNVGEYLKARRCVRPIDLKLEREKQECTRLMKTFETLVSLSRRQLKRFYNDIEAEMPRLGQGLDTFSNIAKESDQMQKGEVDGVDEDDEDDKAEDVESVWAKTKTDTKDHPGDTDQSELMESYVQPIEEDIGDMMSRKGVTVRRRSHARLASLNQRAIEEEVTEGQEIAAGGLTSEPETFLEENETSPAKDDTFIEKQATGGNDKGAFSFFSQTSAAVDGNLDDSTRALQRDVNHVLAEIDRNTEYTLLCIASIIVVLTFAEMQDEKEVFSKYSALAHELSMDFISNTLKTVWDLLNKELSEKMTLAALRDPGLLRDMITNLLELRAVNGVVPKHRMRKLSFKFATLHDMFTATDIHIFPNFVQTHKDGAKCAHYSAFDSNLWLTGGYDCVIRISDIRISNRHICLAQYSGHKSIITDVHFTRNDSQIVSSSFDRTLKIWNAATATVEKTLLGHTDAVTCCDVTPDARYIASGSTDSTVRLWEYVTGDCITVVKKHTKWIKCVRFSPDGRYLATAGLDHKVYIWETKILANSRSPSHSRCFDSFGDYVLDLALFRPSLLLTTARDCTVRLFDYMTGHELQNLSLSPSWACSVCFSSNGEYFATGSFDNNVLIFRTKDFHKMREIRVFNMGITCVRFPKDLSYILVCTSEGFIQQIPL